MESSSVQKKQNEQEKGQKIKGELKNGKDTSLSTGWQIRVDCGHISSFCSPVNARKTQIEGKGDSRDRLVRARRLCVPSS